VNFGMGLTVSPAPYESIRADVTFLNVTPANIEQVIQDAKPLIERLFEAALGHLDDAVTDVRADRYGGQPRVVNALKPKTCGVCGGPFPQGHRSDECDAYRVGTYTPTNVPVINSMETLAEAVTAQSNAKRNPKVIAAERAKQVEAIKAMQTVLAGEGVPLSILENVRNTLAEGASPEEFRQAVTDVLTGAMSLGGEKADDAPPPTVAPAWKRPEPMVNAAVAAKKGLVLE